MIAAIVAASAAFCIECFCLYQFANSKTCSHGSHNGDQGKAHYSGDIAALIDIELQRLSAAHNLLRAFDIGGSPTVSIRGLQNAFSVIGG
jgi:hypothetical protein